MRHDLTILQVRAIMTMLGDELADDEELKLDTLEGETDLFELVRKLLDRIERAEGDKAVLVSQIQDRNERKARAEKRIDAHRTAIMALMEAAEIDRLPLPEATYSLRKIAPKPVVVDENLLPDELCRITRKPDMAAIKQLETIIPGLAMDNGGTSLTIRRK